MEEKHRNRSLFFPMLLVAAGVVILLVNIGTIEGSIWDNLSQYWPVLLILGGLDGLYKRDGWVGPLVLIGLGTVLLLGNLKYLPMGAWALLVRLWPVLLIAIGLDIFLNKRGSSLSTLLRVGFGVLLVGGIVFFATTTPYGAGMKSIPVEQLLEGETSSDILFSVAAGKLEIQGGAEKDLLLTGTAGLPRNMNLEPKYDLDGNKSSFQLDAEGVVFIPLNSSFLPWDFRLNSEVSIDLRTETGAGEVSLDLADLNTRSVVSELAVGKMSVTLPCNVDMEVNLSLAVGELELIIPKGCELKVQLENGLVAYDLPVDYQRVNDLVLNQHPLTGMGEINLKTVMAIGKFIIREMD